MVKGLVVVLAVILGLLLGCTGSNPTPTMDAPTLTEKQAISVMASEPELRFSLDQSEDGNSAAWKRFDDCEDDPPDYSRLKSRLMHAIDRVEVWQARYLADGIEVTSIGV